jgi:regulator of replication initiation timing
MFKKYVILSFERYSALVKGNLRSDTDDITTAIRSTLAENTDPEVKRAKLKPLLKKRNTRAKNKRETDELQLLSVKKRS